MTTNPKPTFVIIPGDVFFGDAEVKKLVHPFAKTHNPGTFMVFTGLCVDDAFDLESLRLAKEGKVYSTGIGVGNRGGVPVPDLSGPDAYVFANLTDMDIKRIKENAEAKKNVNIIESKNVAELAMELGKVIRGKLVEVVEERPPIVIATGRENLKALIRSMRPSDDFRFQGRGSKDDTPHGGKS